ncbi:MAG: hypothetical protein LBE09_03490 [Christensenellaceae bacterium]|jgi:transposase|nr:hypothetical protein [Christensenellaceae bacterium]
MVINERLAKLKTHRVKQKDSKTGIVYVYEAVSYYDKVARYRKYVSRKLIGHIDNVTGEFVANRPWHKKDEIEIDPPFFGAYHVVSHILKATNLLDDLKLISADDYSSIIAVVSYFVFGKATGAMNFDKWMNVNFMENCAGLSSHSVSELFVRLSKINLDAFFTKRFKKVKNVRLLLGSTSISTNLDGRELIEWAKGKDKDPAPQTGLAMILDSKTQWPVWYQELTGNRDVDLIKHIVSETANYKIKILTLCLDEEFYTESNTHALLSESFDFLIGLKPSTNNVAGNLIQEYIKNIVWGLSSEFHPDAHTHSLQVDYPIKLNSKTVDNVTPTETVNLKANMYYSVDRYASESIEFSNSLVELSKHLLDVNPDIRLQKLIEKYYIKTDNGYERKYKAIATAMQYNGFFLVLSSQKLTAKEALDIYGSKEEIEKAFSLVNELDFPTPGEKNAEMLRGKLLCSFLALIIQAEIKTRFRKANILVDQTELETSSKKAYSPRRKETLENVLNEIAMITGKSSKKGKNKHMIASETQNEYLQALGIPIIKDQL